MLKAPVPKEPLSGKWEEMLDWPETRDRVMVQNYYTGRIRLSKPSQAQKMVDQVNRKKDDPNPVNPVWRLVPEDEREELWKAEVYCEYCHHKAIWGRHEAARFEGLVEALGGAKTDIDMIEDSNRRTQAVKANRAEANRQKHVETVKKYASFGGMTSKDRNKFYYSREGSLQVWLREHARQFLSARDVEELKKREAKVFQQEQMRENARQSVRAEYERAKSGPVGTAAE